MKVPTLKFWRGAWIYSCSLGLKSTPAITPSLFVDRREKGAPPPPARLHPCEGVTPVRDVGGGVTIVRGFRWGLLLTIGSGKVSAIMINNQ